ncbi:TetR family transcriptional regulator C-terminal domain-containing protein [Pyruvatibacter sp.]|uniref:TetR/AcrR family transcriptional regulator n=1 Tax=Pyruvatibacter sp. TaxID=1981328 RepID=UPI003265A300
MPKSVDPLVRRDEFIVASWNVIAREGLAAASLRRVSAEAGCTTGALTHYFSDRQALLTATLRQAHFAAGKRMQAAVHDEASDFGRLRAVLLEALPLDATRLREWKVWLCFWGAAMNDDELSDEDSSRYAEWRKLLKGLLAPLHDDPAQEALLLVSMVDGLGLQLARSQQTGTALKRRQNACLATLDAYLTRFQS